MNITQSPILFGLLLALTVSHSAIAREAAHDHHEHASASTSLPALTTLSPLAARFKLSINKTHTDWYLWREANQIETANPLVGQNDIWQRDERNTFTYRRIFHNDKRVVEYTPGELKTRHAEPDWGKLASVVSPSLLDALKRGGSKTLFGQKAVRYSGKLGDQTIELWWLEQARLPASLSMSSPQQRMQMKLRELHASAPAAWPRTNEAGIADYGVLDAADFGDMESDPFVARLLMQEGHAHTH